MKSSLYRYTPYILGLIFVVPHAVYAQEGLQEILIGFEGIFDSLIFLAASLALLYFFWGLAHYILDTQVGDGDKSKSKSKGIIKRGIIAIFIIAAIWGIVELIGTTLGINPGQSAPPIEDITPSLSD